MNKFEVNFIKLDHLAKMAQVAGFVRDISARQLDFHFAYFGL
jgi:hypothetical protein